MNVLDELSQGITNIVIHGFYIFLAVIVAFGVLFLISFFLDHVLPWLIERWDSFKLKKAKKVDHLAFKFEYFLKDYPDDLNTLVIDYDSKIGQITGIKCNREKLYYKVFINPDTHKGYLEIFY